MLNNPLLVCWDINNICNFKCSYCYNKDTKATKHYYFDEIINKLLMLPVDKYDINIQGGEPTLYKDLSLLLDKIEDKFQDKLMNISIVTNGSAGQNFWLQFKNRVQIKMSLHLEYFNDKYYFELIDFLIKNDFEIYLRLMFLPEKVDLIKDIIKFVEPRKDHLICECKYIFQYKGKYTREDEKLCDEINEIYGFGKSYSKNAFLIFPNKVFSFKREFRCSVPIHIIKPERFKETFIENAGKYYI